MSLHISQPLYRRALRLLRAINLLHRRGFEDLTCTFFAGNELDSWMMAICHIDNLIVDGVNRTAKIIDESADVYLHQHTNQGNEYFGWNDLNSASAEELANAIEERCAPLLNKSRGVNRENVGWFTQVLGFTEVYKKLPYTSVNPHYETPAWTFVLGTPHFVSLPPACKVFTVENDNYYFKRIHIHQYQDWHTAHIDIINAIHCDGVVAVPQYPIKWATETEMGAYWEGAVYFVFKYLRINSTEEFLLFLEGQRSEYSMADWFYRIYDSKGQLDYFIAFVARRHIYKHRDKTTLLQTRWKNWLKVFEDRTRPKYVPADSYLSPINHNPFYGGDNPLHLGLVFTNEEANWLNH
jgi:hypothetical protein